MTHMANINGMKCSGMKCSAARRLFSPYLDGAVSGVEMQALQAHLETCAACHRHYTSLRHSQQLLMSAGRPKAPADLGLKLRLAISREAAQAERPYEGLRVRIENALNAFMVPATAGLVSAVIIFSMITAILATPGQLQANTQQDVPLMLNTGPELQQSVFGELSINADSLVIEADVDANGRIQDYRILSEPGASDLILPQVKQMLIFTTFRPAMSMGRPISSRAVLSFSKISVRG